MRRFILLLILLAAYMAVSEMDFREQAPSRFEDDNNDRNKSNME